MLRSIEQFFKTFSDILTSLIEFVVDLVEDLVYVVTLCGEFVAKIPDLFSWLPNEILALIITLFAIVVIYKILGREG